MFANKKVRKKILFIITKLDGGGAEKALIELLHNFDYTQYEVSLLVLYSGGKYWNDIPKEVCVSVVYEHLGPLYRKSFRYYRKYGSTLLFSILIRRKIKRNYDVIISFLEGIPLLFHSLILPRGRKNITWVHCDLFNFRYTVPDGFLNKEAEENAYRSVDEIIFVSRNAMDNFDKLYKIDTHRRFLYNLINKEEIIRLSKGAHSTAAKMTITTVGRLTKVKGFDKLVYVARKFKDAGYDLCFQIMGDGEENENLRNLAKKLNVEEEMSFLEFRKNPYFQMASSDIFVSTSLSEGLSRVICEAFVLSLPIVATKSAGALELLDNGRYGLLVEHDIESIYQGLKCLVDNEEMRIAYRQKSQERARMFDVGQAMSDVYNLL